MVHSYAPGSGEDRVFSLLTAKGEYLEPYGIAIQAIPVELDELRKLTSDNPAEQSRIETLRSLVAKKLGELRKTVDLRRTGHAAAAVEIVSTDRGNHAMNQIRTVIQAMKAEELSLLDWRNERRLATRSMILVMTIGAGILLLVLLGGSRAIDRSTTARARAEAAEKTQREWLQVTLASIGDESRRKHLTRSIYVESA
jgi:methyl-accepting chemotaxis protein